MTVNLRPVPMMEDAEILAMTMVLTSCDPKRVLEWGSGGSTLYFPKMFGGVEWVSIEHSPDWARAVKARAPKNVTLHQLDFPDYYQRPSSMGKFDVIIVDGRQRVECLSRARSMLSDGGIVILHDAGRQRYSSAWGFYRTSTVLVDPKPGKDPRGLVVFRDPVLESEVDVSLDCGIIYMCWGDPATFQAEASMQSLWHHDRRASVMVVGDDDAVKHFSGRPRVMTVKSSVNPFKSPSSQGFMAGRVKPLLAGLSPFEKTIYVDAETEFKRPPAEVFRLLDTWDFVIAEAESRDLSVPFPDNVREAKETTSLIGTPHILYHNSGMFGWRKCKETTELFRLWSDEWQRYSGWDEQVALLRALLKSDALFLNLPYTWNCRGPVNTYFVYHRFASKAARKYSMFANYPSTPRADRMMRHTLVSVEVSPGVIVKCHAGDEEKVIEMVKQRGGRSVGGRQ